jgi:uncharacterized protein DUF397
MDLYPANSTSGATSVQKWIKSSFSYANGNCVEVAGLSSDRIGVRDSQNPGGPVLAFTPAQWDAFVGGVRGGKLP